MDFGRELTLNRLIRWLEPESRALVMGVALVRKYEQSKS
jgi:hypothetical protein